MTGRALIVMAAVLAACAALISPACAMTIEEAISAALASSDAASMAELAERAAMAEASAEASFTRPQVRLSAEYLLFSSSGSIYGPLFPVPEGNVSVGVEAGQLVYGGGRITGGIRLREERVRIASLQREAALRELVKGVRVSYFSVLFQRAMVDIFRERVALREQELRDAEDLREAGMVTSLDVRQAQLNLNLAREGYEAGVEGYREAVVAFNLAVGRSGATEAGEADLPEGSLQRAAGLANTLGMLEDRLSAGDLPALREAESAYRAAGIGYDMARGGRMPEVRVVASGTSEGEDPSSMQQTLAAGVMLSMALYDGGRTGNAVDAAEAGKRAAEDRLRFTRKELAGSVLTLKARAASLASRMELKTQAVKLSSENYEDARGHYRAGTITLTRLGEVNLAYAEARFQLQQLYFEEQRLLADARSLLK